MKVIVAIFAIILILISGGVNIYNRITFNRSQNEFEDDIYWEFEENDPEYARFLKLSRLSFSGIVLGVLLLFAATVL